RVFELARVFAARGAGELPAEHVELAAAITGGDERLWGPRGPLFFELKGAAGQGGDPPGGAARLRPRAGGRLLHPVASAAIEAGGAAMGVLGELHPETAARFEIDAPCGLLLLDLDAIAALPAVAPHYHEVSRQPSVRRDLAVLLAGECAVGAVLD